MRALVVANARFWVTVAPVMWRELSRWRRQAAAISDPQLRQLALEKLETEAFNAEVAATLATLAPRAQRQATVKAIVAMEVLFDYLDGRTELVSADPLAEGQRAFEPFIAAVSGNGRKGPTDGASGEEAYVWALSQSVSDDASGLPGFEAARDLALAAAARCAHAQSRLHAAPTLGDGQLQQWAKGASAGSGLRWPEYVGGCASSVLAVHALIAAAASPGLGRAEASAIDQAYLAIGAVITTLDSLVDEEHDRQRGERGFSRLFEDREELQARLTALTRLALARAREAPNGSHHAMTLAGVAAYYTTHPGADSPAARPIAAAVRSELAPTIWPTLAVMRMWRAGKSAKALLRASGALRAARRATDDKHERDA
jgi:tetraprenyl-beta-curcumene synthase